MFERILDFLVLMTGYGRFERSHPVRLLFRLCFGLFGAVVGFGGAVKALLVSPSASSAPQPAIDLTVAAMLFFLGCFALFNVGLARPWKWPGICFLASFVAAAAAHHFTLP